MDKLLMKIQDTVMKYADIVSQIADIDVEVVDNELFRVAGTGMNRLPLRYWPVRELGLARISSMVPSAVISPPWMPAPGPTSTM